MWWCCRVLATRSSAAQETEDMVLLALRPGQYNGAVMSPQDVVVLP
ncbi:hypothetical protein V3C99_010314 [Haemonchus contortus]